KTIVLEWGPAERPLLRALARELAQQPAWELVLLRTRPLGARPPLPRRLRGRVHVRTAFDGPARADVFRSASVFVPALDGVQRAALEAQAGGTARGPRRWRGGGQARRSPRRPAVPRSPSSRRRRPRA